MAVCSQSDITPGTTVEVGQVIGQIDPVMPLWQAHDKVLRIWMVLNQALQSVDSSSADATAVVASAAPSTLGVQHRSGVVIFR